MPRRLLIRNGIAALPHGPSRCDILCDGTRIVAVGSGLEDGSADTLDASGLVVGPGFVDAHVHGGGGFSFFSPAGGAVSAYAHWVASRGVTSFLVSTVGPSAQETAELLRTLAPEVGATGDGAEPLGFHLEGPFLNPIRRGAFHPDMLREPAREEFWRYQRAARGLIRQVTFAPELHGGLELAAAIVASGAIAAMGHTDATAEEARRGFDAGVRHVTHLFNAMRPLHQREGGPLAAALLDANVTCELICDGTHVAPDILRLAYRLLGPNRFVAVTDNLQIAGTNSLAAQFAGFPVEVDGLAARKADGTIVGSVATMDAHFRTVVDVLGVDPWTAFRLCSSNGARVAGAHDRKGAIQHGFDADLVLLDRTLAVAATVCRGTVVYSREPSRLALLA